MNRAEHLAWAKERALEYVAAGELQQALTSIVSDLNKHDELADHPGNSIGMMLLITGNLSTPHAMQKHIEGHH